MCATSVTVRANEIAKNHKRSYTLDCLLLTDRAPDTRSPRALFPHPTGQGLPLNLAWDANGVVSANGARSPPFGGGARIADRSARKQLWLPMRDVSISRPRNRLSAGENGAKRGRVKVVVGENVAERRASMRSHDCASGGVTKWG